MKDGLHEEFEDLDLSDEEFGFDDSDLEDIAQAVGDGTFEVSGLTCRVDERECDEIPSNQKWYIVGVQCDIPEKYRDGVARSIESDYVIYDGEWLEVPAGPSASMYEESAIDEAQWLAEQVVMVQNDADISA